MCSASVPTLISLPIQTPNHRHFIRCRSLTMSSSTIDNDDQSRGGLPRFYSGNLPTSKVAESRMSLLATAGATPVINAVSSLSVESGGIFIVGPEGDFTREEAGTLINAGALPIGLGPCHLRVETATVALLSALELWSDHWNSQFSC